MIRFGRLIKSFAYAFKGLVKVFREEQNLKIQTILSAVAIILGLYFNIKPAEWAFIILAMGLVMATEIANSAVERIADVLKPRINSYVKEIKDIMAAAVFMSALAALLGGLFIFWPYLYKIFGQF